MSFFSLIPFAVPQQVNHIVRQDKLPKYFSIFHILMLIKSILR
jgi:hypothetical protein